MPRTRKHIIETNRYVNAHTFMIQIGGYVYTFLPRTRTHILETNGCVNAHIFMVQIGGYVYMDLPRTRRIFLKQMDVEMRTHS